MGWPIDLENRIALVTGATRGVGLGAALALADAKATVIVTGRSVTEGKLPGTLEATRAEIERRGGRGVAIRCDHGNDEEVQDLFRRVHDEFGRLDILVNNVFAVPSGPFWDTPFWRQPIVQWDLMHRVGLRSHYLASQLAAPAMVEAGDGLIVHISSVGGGRYTLNVAYGVGKAAVDRMAKDMAHDLKDTGVTVVSLWPGIVKTERMMMMKDQLPFPVEAGESAELTGRAIANLYADAKRAQHAGKVLEVARMAVEYDFTDVDGRVPEPLTSRGAS